MREILVYDDYEIHKLGAGGGTQYEEVTTENATRIDVTDVAKPKGKLIPFGRTLQNGEPTPENQIPVENVEGRSCTNLFNKNGDFNYPTDSYIDATTLLEDGTIQTTANAQSNASKGLRLFLKPNTDYVVSGKLLSSTGTGYTSKARVRLMGYKTNWKALTENNLNEFGNFSFSFNSGNNSDWFLSLNALGTSGNNYVAIYDEIQINKGSTAMPYEPYFEGKRLEFNVCNKNLVKGLRVGNYMGSTGEYNANANYSCSKFPIYVKSGSAYKFSKDGIGIKGYAYPYDKDNNYLGRVYFEANSYYTPSQDTYYFNYAFGDSSISQIPLDSNVQIEEGTTVTSYEEHKEQMIPFPLQDGQKLMEGDYLADDGIHHVRGQVVFDGTETWKKDVNRDINVDYFYLRNIPIDRNNIDSVKCNYFLQGTQDVQGFWATSVFCITIDKTFTGIISSDTIEERIDKFKTWLATQYANGTPVIVEYELAEETIEPYTSAQAEAYNKLKNLMLYKGVNHIWTNTDGLEPNLQLTYKRVKQEGVLQVSSIQPLNNLELTNTEETPEEITTEISEE